jgi:hypothetical protein
MWREGNFWWERADFGFKIPDSKFLIQDFGFREPIRASSGSVMDSIAGFIEYLKRSGIRGATSAA